MGPHWAATSIPKRVVFLDREVLRERGEFERILVHELFHFVWVRLSNETRRQWSDLLAAEFGKRAKGELGWSAELRKERLSARDARFRTAVWQGYIRESFCDSAAWLYSGLTRHEEFSLAPRWSGRRAAWLKNLATNGLRL